MDKDEYLEKIAKESGVAKEDIAGIYTDDEKGEVIIFKRNLLVNQLQKVSMQICDSFDQIYASEFADISSDLSEVMALISIGLKEVRINKKELLVTCGDLLWNSSNTIASSVQTLRCGYRLQSGILLRSVIEMCATVTHLILQPDVLKDFKNDKIKSTYSISVANKEIPLFGKAWGILSKKQIHINSLHADLYPVQEYKDKEEIPAEVTIGMIGVVIMILRITTELTFYPYVDEHKYWNSEGDNKVSFIPPDNSDIDWIKEKLRLQ